MRTGKPWRFLIAAAAALLMFSSVFLAEETELVFVGTVLETEKTEDQTEQRLPESEEPCDKDKETEEKEESVDPYSLETAKDPAALEEEYEDGIIMEDGTMEPVSDDDSLTEGETFMGSGDDPEVLEACGADMTASSGECGAAGDNLTWEITGSALSISGSGAMLDYTEETPPPWSGNMELRSIDIGDGVESIGEYAFYGCFGVEVIYLPDSIMRIGQNAFKGCSINLEFGNHQVNSSD